MLDAHVRFELERYAGESLRDTVQEEISALFEWFGTVKLNAVATEAQVIDWLQRNIVSAPISDAALDSIQESVQVAFEFLQEDQTKLEDLVPRALFDRAAANVARMDSLRREITRQVVSSSVYTMLISDVLYHGIKGFILTENALARKIPGASSLVRFGQSALNSAAPQMEKNIDKQLIAFIHDNIQDTLRESERFLDSALNEKTMAKVANELWEANAQTTVAQLAGYADSRSVAGAVDMIKDFWLHFRATPFFQELVEQIVHNFFLRYGRKDIRTVLGEVGIDQEMIVQGLYVLVQPLVQHAIESGYLEARIRCRLSAFYDSYSHTQLVGTGV
jgi:hypothetical protein